VNGIRKVTALSALLLAAVLSTGATDCSGGSGPTKITNHRVHSGAYQVKYTHSVVWHGVSKTEYGRCPVGSVWPDCKRYGN
jgi:hypothetical protein